MVRDEQHPVPGGDQAAAADRQRQPQMTLPVDAEATTTTSNHDGPAVAVNSTD
jgi:hypothetical protein